MNFGGNPAIYAGMSEFLDCIERFLKRTGMSATEFGRRALGDPNFVHDCREGRMPRLDTALVVETFMDKHAKTAA